MPPGKLRLATGNRQGLPVLGQESLEQASVPDEGYGKPIPGGRGFIVPSGYGTKIPGKHEDLVPCDGVTWLQSGASFDPDLTGIGGSPYRGDMGQTGVVIPREATTGQDNRYLARLAVVTIPSGAAVVVRGLMQAATILGPFTTSVQDDTETVIGPVMNFEREIVSPLWHLPFGDISWHLRWKQTKAAADVHDPAQVAGTSPQVDGTDASLLYSQLSPYITLRGGIPPGDAVGDLGTFRDIRFPWGTMDYGLAHLIMGPGQVAFYASVFQPDRTLWVVEGPSGDNPITLASLSSSEGLRPEDQFLKSLNPGNVSYGRVAGAILYEPFPCCEDALKGHL